MRCAKRAGPSWNRRVRTESGTQQPDLTASVELSAVELRTSLLLKRGQKKRNETVPDAMPSIAQATRWIADLGGYTSKSSGGPPGSLTPRRGLDEVRAGARVLEALEC